MDCCRTARAPALSWPMAATTAGGPLSARPDPSSLLMGPAHSDHFPSQQIYPLEVPLTSGTKVASRGVPLYIEKQTGWCKRGNAQSEKDQKE